MSCRWCCKRCGWAEAEYARLDGAVLFAENSGELLDTALALLALGGGGPALCAQIARNAVRFAAAEVSTHTARYGESLGRTIPSALQLLAAALSQAAGTSLQLPFHCAGSKCTACWNNYCNR